MSIKKIEYKDIISNTDISNAAINNEFIGFREDYLVIHSLVSELKPNHIFEIGTNTGMGCLVMKTASPSSKITTLDIVSCGNLCPDDTNKIVGDSTEFNYEPYYPINCWFIDGDHTYKNAYKESIEAIKSNAELIIYHDADIDEVYNAIEDAFLENDIDENYDLYQVINPPFIYSLAKKNVTRILYAKRK